ncbi:DUF222 domain-containing protein [Propioniciclava soli]|uniref:DUF222 domain-containing protein n=1 Tax=Propioniciclava soli TaxID=2775081 RepID=A0ABZ3C6N1_9ACTN
MSSNKARAAAVGGVISAAAADNLAALDHATAQLESAEVAQLICLANACDLHRIDAAVIVDGCERLVSLGGDGTPQVGEFLAAEVGAMLRIGPGAAKRRLAQALNLRHRHPQLWDLTMRGLVRVWQAVWVADACVEAGISQQACAVVDGHCAVALAMQPFGRVRDQLAGWILLADTELAHERAERTAGWRGVRVEPIREGATALSGKLDARDGVDLDDALGQLAQQLPTDLDFQHRRALSLGMLARHALGQDELPDVASLAPGGPGTGRGAGGNDDPTVFVVDAAGFAAPRRTPADGRADGDTGADAAGLDESVTDAAAGWFTQLIGATKPRTRELVIHLDADALRHPERGVATVEGWGVLLADQLGGLLKDATVICRPVIDPGRLPATDAYGVPERMRHAVEVRNPVEVFPWGTARARACQLDHTVPFDHDAPSGAGQTRPDNLGPLGAFTHRVKTHGGWRVEQPMPGVFCWESPAGFRYLVTPTGTTLVRRPPPRTGEWWTVEPPGWLDEPDPPEHCDPRDDTRALTAV